VSALSGAGSPTQQAGTAQSSTSVTTTVDDDGDQNREENEEELAAALENFLSIDDEGGDCGDSDEEGDECIIHTTGMDLTSKKGSSDVELSPEDDRGEVKGLVKLTATGSGQQIGNVIIKNNESSVIALDGCTIGDGSGQVKIPRMPKDYSPPGNNPNRNEPAFKDVDNPGNWPEYCFKPEFHGNNRSKSTKYKHHQLPTGAVPFPTNSEGKRKNANGWEFFYKGWENAEKPYRREATTANMFPKEMDGCVDADILKKLGLTRKRMGLGLGLGLGLRQTLRLHSLAMIQSLTLMEQATTRKYLSRLSFRTRPQEIPSNRLSWSAPIANSSLRMSTPKILLSLASATM